MASEKPHVWVIEILYSPGKWGPCQSGYLTKESARFVVGRWKKMNPEHRYRVAKYERVK